MKLDKEATIEQNLGKQFTLCRRCNVELESQQVIRTRIGHVIGCDEEALLCDHSTLCRPCYNELMGLVDRYIGVHNETCGVVKMAKKKLKEITVGSNIPVLKLEGKWVVSEEEELAAWKMYVELITRISVAELKPDEGFLREALSSLYSLFGITRQILKDGGPSIAQPQGEGKFAFGYLAVAILNRVLRPVLAKWHPLLHDYEHTRKEDVSELEHENRWERAQELRDTLNETRKTLIIYANLLADAAGVPSLIVER